MSPPIRWASQLRRGDSLLLFLTATRGETDQTNIGFEWMTLNNSAKIHGFSSIMLYIYIRIITGDSNVVFVSVRKRHLAHPGTKAGDSTGGPTT